MTLQPLTEEIIVSLEGNAPTKTRIGYAVVDGDKVLSVFGLYRDTDRWVLFCQATEEARQGLRSMHVKRMVVEAAKKAVELIHGTRGPVHAGADPKFDGSDRLLAHIGFKYAGEGVWEWQRPQSP